MDASSAPTLPDNLVQVALVFYCVQVYSDSVAVNVVLELLGAPYLFSKIILFHLQNKGKSGEGGIRTHETILHRLRDFQSRSFGQLGHLSVPVEFTK